MSRPAAPTGPSRPTAACARRPASPLIADGKHVAMFGDIRANVYGLDAQTGAQLWKIKVDDHAIARITGAPTLCQRPPLRAGVIDRGGGRSTPEISVLHVSRQRGRARRGDRQAALEELHDSGGAQGRGQELRRHRPMWKPRAPRSGRRRPSTCQEQDLRRDRQRLYESAAPTSDAVVALSMTDGRSCGRSRPRRATSYVIGCKARSRKLSRRRRAGLRLRQLADPAHVARRPSHVDARTKVGHGVRHRAGR